MTAKEMFEKLGYVQTIKNDNLIEYTDHSHGDGGYMYVRFYLISWKSYTVGYYDSYVTTTKEATLVSIKEHEAITKQMKELGWI